MVTTFYKNLMMIFALGMLWRALTRGIATWQLVCYGHFEMEGGYLLLLPNAHFSSPIPQRKETVVCMGKQNGPSATEQGLIQTKRDGISLKDTFINPRLQRNTLPYPLAQQPERQRKTKRKMSSFCINLETVPYQ